MKKIITVFITLIFVLTTVIGCSPEKKTSQSSVQASSEATSSKQEKKLAFIQSIESKAIAANKLGDSGKKDLVISLPPSYYTDESKRYPVVYFFHGYDEGAGVLASSIKQLQSAMQKSGAKEFIVVEVSGENKYGGSYYVNSPIIGNYEDFVIKEAIPYIDTNYRTIATKEGRGASGFSMGGFACLNLALKHPDVFSSVYSLSPGVFDKKNGLKDAFKSWDGLNNFKTAYGQAFCPMPEVPDLMTKYPTFDGSKEDNEIVAKWESGYGDFDVKLDEYLELSDKLKAITIQVGSLDSYPWIPNGCSYLSKIMKEKNIKHELITLQDGSHSIPYDFIDTTFVPFFNTNLAY